MKTLKLNSWWKIEIDRDFKLVRIIYENEENRVYCTRCHEFIKNRVYSDICLNKLFLERLLNEFEKDWVETQKDKKIFIEDGLLSNDTVELIRKYHGGKVERVVRHVKVCGKEVDGEIVLKMRTVKRRIGVELKEWNLSQAISQAIERRKFFHYFYIITRINKTFFGDYVYQAIRGEPFFKKMFENKIGWIGYSDRIGFIMLFPSKFMKIGVGGWEKWQG